jgi:hypothetical protein
MATKKTAPKKMGRPANKYIAVTVYLAFEPDTKLKDMMSVGSYFGNEGWQHRHWQRRQRQRRRDRLQGHGQEVRRPLPEEDRQGSGEEVRRQGRHLGDEDRHQEAGGEEDPQEGLRTTGSGGGP